MKWFRKKTLGVSLLLLTLSATCAVGQDKKPAAKEIDAATIAAYEKLGAEYVRWEKFYLYAQVPETAHEGLPDFQFRGFPEGKLPDVAVPFALEILFTDVVTDAQMRELAGLKNLTALSADRTCERYGSEGIGRT